MGCFATGCLVVVILCVFFAGAAGIGAWLFYSKAVGVFTSAQPADVRIENVSDIDLQHAETKLNRLGQATASNQETTIDFNAAELNAMIAREPLFAELNNRVRVEIADSLMTVKLSVSLGVVGWPKLKGRWFNGTARFGFSFSNDEFAFEPKSGEANGRALPDEFFTGIAPSLNRGINDAFHRELEKSDASATFWKHIKTIALDRDKVVISTQRL